MEWVSLIENNELECSLNYVMEDGDKIYIVENQGDTKDFCNYENAIEAYEKIVVKS